MTITITTTTITVIGAAYLESGAVTIPGCKALRVLGRDARSRPWRVNDDGTS